MPPNSPKNLLKHSIRGTIPHFPIQPKNLPAKPVITTCYGSKKHTRVLPIVSPYHKVPRYPVHHTSTGKAVQSIKPILGNQSIREN